MSRGVHGPSAPKEKDLYPVLTNHMKTSGFSEVVGAARHELFVLPVVLQAVDALGCRWTDDGDVDAWAVEAKRGGTKGDVRAAFAQAVAYSAVVPRVSIATPAGAADLEAIQPYLDQLNLGHVSLSRSGASSGGVPKQALLFQREVFNRTTRHAVVLLLLAREVFGVTAELRPHADVWPSDDEAKPDVRDGWGGWRFAVHTTSSVQWMFWIPQGSDRVIASIWVEDRRRNERLLRADRLEDEIVGVLPDRDDVVLGVWPVLRRRGKPHAPKLGCRNNAGCSPVATSGLVRHAREVLKEPFASPRFWVGLPLWTMDEVPMRPEATTRLRLAMDQLMPAYRLIEAKIGSRPRGARRHNS